MVLKKCLLQFFIIVLHSCMKSLPNKAYPYLIFAATNDTVERRNESTSQMQSTHNKSRDNNNHRWDYNLWTRDELMALLSDSTNDKCSVLHTVLHCSEKFQYPSDWNELNKVNELLGSTTATNVILPQMTVECFPQTAGPFQAPFHYENVGIGWKRLGYDWYAVRNGHFHGTDRGRSIERKIVAHLLIVILPMGYVMLLLQNLVSIYGFWRGGKKSSQPYLHQISLCLTDLTSMHLISFLFYYRFLNLHVLTPCWLLRILPWRTVNYTLTLLGPLHLIGISLDQIDSLYRLEYYRHKADHRLRAVLINAFAWATLTIVTLWLHFMESHNSDLSHLYFPYLSRTGAGLRNPDRSLGHPDHSLGRISSNIRYHRRLLERNEVYFRSNPYAFREDKFCSFFYPRRLDCHQKPIGSHGDPIVINLKGFYEKMNVDSGSIFFNYSSTCKMLNSPYYTINQSVWDCRLLDWLRGRTGFNTKLPCPYHGIDMTEHGAIVVTSISFGLIVTLAVLNLILIHFYRKRQRLIADLSHKNHTDGKKPDSPGGAFEALNDEAGDRGIALQNTSPPQTQRQPSSKLLIYALTMQITLQTLMFFSMTASMERDFISRRFFVWFGWRTAMTVRYALQFNLGVLVALGLANYVENFVIFLIISKTFRQEIKRILLINWLEEKLRQWILDVT